jgi:membrane-associated protease RseP (regulator of RpoE activity)
MSPFNHRALARAAAIVATLGPAVASAAPPAGPSIIAPQRGRLGIQVMELSPELRGHFGAPPGGGVLVSRVEDASAARAAGVQAGDVIVEVDGDEVASGSEIVGAIGDRKKGEAVSIVVLRDRARRTLSATLRSDPDATAAFDRPGGFDLDLDPATRGWRRALGPGDVAALEKRLADLEKRIAELERKR